MSQPVKKLGLVFSKCFAVAFLRMESVGHYEEKAPWHSQRRGQTGVCKEAGEHVQKPLGPPTSHVWYGEALEALPAFASGGPNPECTKCS